MEKPDKDKTAETVLKKCTADGTRCSICGGAFPDGDNVCANGHILEEKYPVKASISTKVVALEAER